jgi:hypothetical protein
MDKKNTLELPLSKGNLVIAGPGKGDWETKLYKKKLIFLKHNY